MNTVNNTINTSRFKRIDLEQAFSEKPPPLDFVLPGMLAGTVGALVAQGGVGKSWLALELAIAVAGGPDLLEIGVEKTGSVLYLAAEDPALALRHRFFAAASHFDAAACKHLAKALEIVPLMSETVDLFELEWFHAFARMAKGKRLVVIDTLRRFHSGDENSAGDMSKLLGVMEDICSSTGASLLFLHHANKSASNAASQQSSRGSSVLVDNVRGGQLNLLKMTDEEAKNYKINRNVGEYVKLVHAKSNFGEKIENKWFWRAAGGVLLSVDMERNRHDQSNQRAEKAATNASQSSRHRR